MELPELIKERRAQLGMTQVRLAELLGRSASTIRSWERGASTPPADLKPRLASALGLEPAQLESNEGVESDATPEDDGPELLEAAVVSEPDPPEVDHTTVMAAGIAMAVPVEEQVTEDEASADEPDYAVEAVEGNGDPAAEPDELPDAGDGLASERDGLASERDEPASGRDEPASGRDDDTDESEVIDVAPVDQSAMPRLLGTALSTDVVPDLEETKVVAPLSATQVIGSSTSAAVAASPYPEARGSATVMPAGSSETDWSEVRTYQTRRILTIAAFVGLIIVLRWAMGGFAEGFNTLKDSILSNMNL